MTGALAVNKLGPGTTILSASNTYTGATTIESGTLKLDINGSIAGLSSVKLFLPDPPQERLIMDDPKNIPDRAAERRAEADQK